MKQYGHMFMNAVDLQIECDILFCFFYQIDNDQWCI